MRWLPCGLGRRAAPPRRRQPYRWPPCAVSSCLTRALASFAFPAACAGAVCRPFIARRGDWQTPADPFLGARMHARIWFAPWLQPADLNAHRPRHLFEAILSAAPAISAHCRISARYGRCARNAWHVPGLHVARETTGAVGKPAADATTVLPQLPTLSHHGV